MHKDGLSKLIVLHVLAATTIGLTCAAAIHHRRRRKSSKPISKPHQPTVPLLDRSESGHVAKLEKFSNYAARQIGFKDGSECPELCKLAAEYMKNSKGCEDIIYEYFSSEENPESLYVKLVEEFERCILSYLAFHWSQASFLVTQVLSAESGDQKKLKNLVMAATRKQRFAKVTKDLKVTRTITTLVEEMKLIGCNVVKGDEACTDVMVPVALSDRSPVLLFMGGGMGAGKSTVLKDILKESFWLGAAAKAVVVEADAFKETDVIYRALSSHGHHQDMLQTAELVHQTSTDAASSLLVTALNEGRDVIMDGTLSWEPFFRQTVAMARNVHKHRYRMGIGYKVLDDGTILENYWEQVDEDDQEKDATDNPSVNRKPYRIELVGVVCDAYLAVARGIRRAIGIKRAVRVKSQLKSHKNFARAFPSYCHLVDNARLYCTSAIGTPPKLIGWKDGHSNLLIDEEEIKCLKAVSDLNDEAESIYELYKDQNRILEPGSVWKEMVLSPTRASLQQELKTVIQKIENTTTE